MTGKLDVTKITRNVNRSTQRKISVVFVCLFVCSRVLPASNLLVEKQSFKGIPDYPGVNQSPDFPKGIQDCPRGHEHPGFSKENFLLLLPESQFVL